MLKPKSFHIPGALLIEQHIVKDGPSPYFVAWKPHTSQLFYSRQNLLRWVRWPKGTPTRESLEEWLSTLEAPKAPSIDMEAIKREGFGPEAHDLNDPEARQ